MKAIARVEQFVFEAKPWKLVLAIALLTLFKTGVWYMPNQGSVLAIAQNPFVNPFADPFAHYLFWSWLDPFLAWLVGAVTKWKLFGFHLAIALAFTLLFLRVAFRTLPGDMARAAVVLFSVLPVSATAYFWVGPDALTLLLLLLALAFPTYRVITFTIGLLLGMQHFEQGVFAVSALLFAVALSQRQGYGLRYTWAFCATLLVGVVGGKLILIQVFDHYDIVVNSGRMHWLRGHFDTITSQFFYHIHPVVWSVLGLGWLAALRFTDWGAKSVPFFLGLVGLCLLLPIVADQTRVLSIITFPLVFTYLLTNPDFLGKLGRREVAWLFGIWALMPWAWVWSGDPKWSVFPHDVAYVLHRLFGWFDVPPDPALWPFVP